MPSRRTGRKSTSIAIWPRPAASCRPTATRAMPSSTPPDPDGTPRLREAPAGRICAGTSTTSGTRPNPRSPARRWTASARSTTSSARSPAARRHPPCRRQKHSAPKVEAFFASGPSSQLALIPGKGDLAKAFRYGLSRWASFSLFLV
jgi:transposase